LRTKSGCQNAPVVTTRISFTVANRGHLDRQSALGTGMIAIMRLRRQTRARVGNTRRAALKKTAISRGRVTSKLDLILRCVPRRRRNCMSGSTFAHIGVLPGFQCVVMERRRPAGRRLEDYSKVACRGNMRDGGARTVTDVGFCCATGRDVLLRRAQVDCSG